MQIEAIYVFYNAMTTMMMTVAMFDLCKYKNRCLVGRTTGHDMVCNSLHKS